MSSSYFLIDTLFNLYLMVVLLRLWLQYVRADFYNPFSQFVVKATQPVVAPLRRVIPALGKLDTATLILALVVAIAKIAIISTLFSNGPFNPLAVLIIGSITLLKQFLSLVFWMLILRAILSWVSQGGNPFELVIAQLTEPLLAPIRKVIPPLGGLDLSVLIAIIALQFIQLLLQDFIGPL
ncbi:YggT family protein [Opacimonas viscosa]|uniref:YggT family protein n=1 Tax=Opacimonas viscosa TaxID=2961944 RepID=A0AA41X073_9ALTE|nr:YggT family protein [Opacimonas viscosa]MCP3427936.1 YggT family protein [Opacimonas viscosa]